MEHKRVLKAVERAGWKVVRRKGGHMKLTGPGGEIVFTSSTPSDHRATLNLIAHLRRLGLEVA